MTRDDDYDLDDTVLSGDPDMIDDQRLQAVIVGTGIFQTLPLPPMGDLTIGRYIRSDIRIDDASISRFHAKLHMGPPLAIDKAREEVGRQLAKWQSGFYDALNAGGFKSASNGPYRGLESAVPWVTCWAATNADALPRPRTAVNSTRSTTATGIFLSDRILTGRVDLSQEYFRAFDLTAFQFAKELSQRAGKLGLDSRGGRRLTAQECRVDFLAATPGGPVLRATCTPGSGRSGPDSSTRGICAARVSITKSCSGESIRTRVFRTARSLITNSDLGPPSSSVFMRSSTR